MKYGCDCIDVEIGSYDNQVHLPAPEHMPKANGYCVDRCLEAEIKDLWSHGIVTTGCCCGHNKLPGYIGVREDFIGAMKDLGYAVRQNETDATRQDGFYPLSIKYETTA